MEVLVTKEIDDFSTLLKTEQPDEAEPNAVQNIENGLIGVESANIMNIDQVNNDDISDALNTITKCLDAPKVLSDSELIVHDLLFDMKSDEFNLLNSDDKTTIDFNMKPYTNNDKNLCMSLPTSTSSFNTSNETHVLSSTDEMIYSDVNNIFMTGKKRGFSIDDISKDESSQNSQSMSTYPNDYTCFLSEQADTISNLTPFKRSNSYFFDSPVKKLCTTKLSSEEPSSKVANGSLYTNENDNKIYTGFTSIQNDLEVDCLQDRYDGSDSGFGSELAEDKNNTNPEASVSTILPYNNEFSLNQESSFEDLQRTSNEFLSAMEVLKPKFADSILDTGPLEISSSSNYGMVKGILKHHKTINYGDLTSDDLILKKRRNINFANVTVFYFPRVQGFTCVPSQVIKFYVINERRYNLFIICFIQFTTICKVAG